MEGGRVNVGQRALNPVQALQLLRQTSAGSHMNVTRVLRIETLEYVASRRLTLRYLVEVSRDGRAPQPYELIGKAYRGYRGERVYALLHRLCRQPPEGLRLPAPLGYHRTCRFLLLEAIPGTPLSKLLRAPDDHLHLHQFGASLAAFHQPPAARPTVPMRGAGMNPLTMPASATTAHPEAPARVDPARSSLPLPVHDVAQEINALNVARAHFGREPSSSPELRERYDRLHLRACEALTLPRDDPNADPWIVHGDLRPEQVLWFNHSYALVDLDDSSQAEPELDVGGFVAQLLVRDLRLLGTIAPALELARTFCAAYARVGRLAATRMRAYTVAALLRQAAVGWLAQQGCAVLDWAAAARLLLDEAERLLDSPWALGGAF